MIFPALLLVDIGNSRIKWAVANLPRIDPFRTFPSRKTMPLPKGEMPTADATPERIRKLGESFPGHYLVLASVVPKLVPLFRRAFRQRFHLVTAESPLGLRFDYPQPAEIGADRLAAAVAVHADGIWPAIVVSCGTATAFTVLDVQGRFCGGAIAPGLEAQLAALVGAAAQLPETTLRSPKNPLARSTREAVRSGVVLNFQGGAKEILRQLKAALPDRKNPRVFLTGGHARHLAGKLGPRVKLRPLLVLEGLLIIGSRRLRPVP